MEIADPKTTETASGPIPNRMDSGRACQPAQTYESPVETTKAPATGKDGLQRADGKFPYLRRPGRTTARRPRACGPLCRLKPAFQTGAAIVDVTERY